MPLANIAHYLFQELLNFDVGSPSLTPSQKQAVTTVNPQHDIQDAVTHFLSDCNLLYSVPEYDREFHDACCHVARTKGYPVDIDPYIPVGVVLSITAYAHLENKSTRIFIALYTAFLTYLDDASQHHMERLYYFNQRFMLHQPHDDPVLDALSEALHELPEHFGQVASSMMLISTLNFMIALLLEYETQDMLVSPDADSYPNFSRLMSGLGESYALFAFPPQIPMQSYIQALPEQRMFINSGNDILSFYKEELDGETVNIISNLAGCQGISKIEALRQLSRDAAASHLKVLQILSPYRDAQTAYANFSQGYIWFHTSLSRYRLNELFPQNN